MTTPDSSKPPLGLMPRWLAEQQRTIAILEAMHRYAVVGLPIPEAWTDELNYLASEKRWRKNPTPESTNDWEPRGRPLTTQQP